MDISDPIVGPVFKTSEMIYNSFVTEDKVIAKAIYLLLAREVTTDTNDQMNSIIKIIDRFGIDFSKENATLVDSGTPKSLQIPYAIASMWLLDEPVKKTDKFTLEVEIVDPAGISLGKQAQEATGVESLAGRIALNLNMGVLIASTSGMYSLQARLLKGGKLLASSEYPYEVSFEPQKQA